MPPSPSQRPKYDGKYLHKLIRNIVGDKRLDQTLTNVEDTLKGNLASADKATQENLENLVEVGNQLLQKPISTMDLDTGLYEPVENGGTNQQALQRFAKLLSDEKKLRESNHQNLT
ncbi:hypothetical protein GBA52_023568 [Prunus armeniaca]|nr:hypothetical protein GBA52_023568 [Prunus armeniaca]